MATPVFILVGVSGAGKSSWMRRAFRPKDHLTVCSADAAFTAPDGSYRFDVSLLGEAHAACLRRFVEAVTAPPSPFVNLVVVDNTNTTAAEVAPYIALAQAYGCHVRILHFDCDAEMAAKCNTHGVPLAGVESQHKRIAAMLADWPPFWPAVEQP